MKWIKHDADANQDAKLQNVLLDYGLEGYGLYWYCIELIAGKVDKDNITFELEHDARIIARNVGSTPEKVEQMMKYFVKAGLFESSDGVITCLKMARRLDQSMTSNKQMREIIDNFKRHDAVMIESGKPMQDQIRLDQNRLDQIKKEKSKEECSSGKPDVRIVIEHFNSVTGQKLKSGTKSHSENISGRLNDGYSVDDLKLVIDFKNSEWAKDPKMAQYIRPATLFQTGKFGGYLSAAKTAPAVKISSLHNLSGISYQSEDL
jgi:uncharacterized phage protein (TIGR02220 family)